MLKGKDQACLEEKWTGVELIDSPSKEQVEAQDELEVPEMEDVKTEL